MSNKKDKKISGLIDETVESSELFSRSRSRDEIKAERRKEAALRRQEAKEARRQTRAANAAELKNHRADILVLASILGVIVLGCIVAFVWQGVQAKEAEKFDRDESKTAFTNSSNRPELEENRVTAAVQRVYYTKGGYLAVEMELGNGTDKLQHLDYMYVEIRNGNKALIGKGSSDQISKKYTIPAGGYNDYTFYISPEYVEIDDDPLTTIACSINIDSDITQ